MIRYFVEYGSDGSPQRTGKTSGATYQNMTEVEANEYETAKETLEASN